MVIGAGKIDYLLQRVVVITAKVLSGGPASLIEQVQEETNSYVQPETICLQCNGWT